MAKDALPASKSARPSAAIRWPRLGAGDPWHPVKLTHPRRRHGIAGERRDAPVLVRRGPSLLRMAAIDPS
jgi:hypothetical protein